MAVIKQNPATQETELWLDGRFVASWAEIQLDDRAKRIVCNMIDQAVQYGESQKVAELRSLLRI